jgi:5-carboxymethyl-2-hydroxymuconate isomerase
MPHCIIEYSNDLTVTAKELIDAVYEGAEESLLFTKDHIKVRTLAYAHHKTVNDKSSFIHVTLKTLAGKDLHQKKHLSGIVLKKLDLLPVFNVYITVEVLEMEVASYSKLLR